MKDTRVTIASLESVIGDTKRNLARIEKACKQAKKDKARVLLLPELMATGHGGHPLMVEKAEEVPGGKLSNSLSALSKKYALCLCVGIAEREGRVVYNSQAVYDKGKFLGLQRKIHMSGDEYLYFGTGERVEVFDIGDIRFGISICYDNLFPELHMAHAFHGVDVVMSPHAARTGNWPKSPSKEFINKRLSSNLAQWRRVHQARAYDHNVYVLLNNSVGSSAGKLEGVVANHAGGLMAIDPDGEIIHESKVNGLREEIYSLSLKTSKRKLNHNPTRNRRALTTYSIIERAIFDKD